MCRRNPSAQPVRATRPRLAVPATSNPSAVGVAASTATSVRHSQPSQGLTTRSRKPAPPLLAMHRMTLPRCVLPGQTVMVTRRCLRRTKLLRPDAALNQLYTYCLAVLAARHGVAVHAVVLMSTHEHLSRE